jgi:NADH-quinone oxidoreductase subunit N
LLGFLVILDYKHNYHLILIKLSGKLMILLSILTIFLLIKIPDNALIFHNFIKIIIISSLILSIIISFDYLKLEKIYSYEYFILVGLALIGMLTLISSNDLILMYLGIEIQSLAFYVLATTKVYNNFSTEAGLKYFILGAFASGLLLLGCSYVYGTFGTTNFEDIYQIYLINNSVLAMPSL